MFLILLILTQIDLSGYVETRPYLMWADSVNISGYNRGWLELKYEGENYGTQVGFDCLVPYDTIGFGYLFEKISISRLALWLGSERLRISVGKQRLYWGVARIFRPFDVFNPINFFEPGYERPGSNAILGYLSIGRLSNIRLISLPKYNLKKSFSGLRIGSNLFKNDIGFNLMHQPSPRRSIIGIEITGDWVIGYWNEMSYNIDDTLNYVKASVGVDYTFPFMLYGMVEFFFDGSGADNPEDYDWQKRINGERITLAKEYLYLSLGFVNNPYLRPAVNTVINLNDHSLILIPQLSHSPGENIEIVAGLNLFAGKETTEFKKTSLFDGQVYIWLRVFF